MYAISVLVAGLVGGYLIGGIPFGFLVAKLVAGIDIRQHGSGNIGATNVGRVLGIRYFFLVFVLDFAKGALPVIAAWEAIPFVRGRFDVGPFLPVLTGFAAILGHLFPIYLGFAGGKGVATSLGVILLLTPVPALCGLAAWAIVVAVCRMVSAGSISFALVFAIAHLVSTPYALSPRGMPLTAFVLCSAMLIILRHQGNIARILDGTEPRIGRSKGNA